jgi:hypothetical protein
MQRSEVRRSLGLAMAAAALVATAAVAQTADSVRQRNDCRLAGQVLRTGQPAPQRTWALQTIAGCSEESGTAVPAVWTAAPTDQDDLGWLVAASVTNRDSRIFDAAMGVAGPTGGPTLVRLAALRVLASYGDRRVWVSWDDLQTRNAIVLPFVDHPMGRDGTSALPSNVRDLVLARLQALGASDPNPAVREAARFLVKAYPRP